MFVLILKYRRLQSRGVRFSTSDSWQRAGSFIPSDLKGIDFGSMVLSYLNPPLKFCLLFSFLSLDISLLSSEESCLRRV
jgi:hypothetical protein